MSSTTATTPASFADCFTSATPTTTASTTTTTPTPVNNNNNNNNKKFNNNNNNGNKKVNTPSIFSEEQIQNVCKEFKLKENDLLPFTAQDPVNNNQLQGLVVKDINDFILMKLNSIDLLEYQYIHVVPKLKKYQSNALPNVSFQRYYIANKWNGMNIQVFKYFDNDGNQFIGCRPRTSHFLANNKNGNVLDIVSGILSRDQVDESQVNSTFKSGSPLLLSKLVGDSNCRSMSFELCGSLVPHIVKYDFEAELKPLMMISLDGTVSPVISSPDTDIVVSPTPIGMRDLLEPVVNQIKSDLLAKNQSYRQQNQLSENMYWFNHFLEEGRVLYILNEQNQLGVPSGNIFAIKPNDTDKFHWEQFDNGIQTKILMIVHELKEKGSPVNKTTLQAELGLDQYSWSKWEDDIMDLAILPEYDATKVTAAPKKKGQTSPTNGADTNSKQIVSNENQRLVITVGYPASGKSYFASKLAQRGWMRVNQDELGTRKKCEDNLAQYLKRGDSVIVDRCNFDIQQRRSWLKIGKQHGVKNILILWFKIDADLCKKRIVVREDHPTIPKGNEGIEIISKFQNMFVDPMDIEGFSNIETINSEEESNLALERFAQMVAQPTIEESNITNLSSLTIEAAV
ncbi:hypothetical protein PPL_11558 [Heterostelium album PN500]|uniref:Uncharacterized protein n=1 Tax=Heterostelium pallidum (strain ATCC 26659 / Pp 5 / PN500) TaxID=670386 RepID=D3BVG7_HETP5|nr:hypothetical protein PPL_11558 [Heterostelium album PN500]EFA74590.1 hypothetical protein PPL_11558 [Heterostelium album PN500]|eukprot:XP_020426724.1 hypothetical protein PPL_11558 [Heterostelium album PN500]